jgi:hypothetical protein
VRRIVRHLGDLSADGRGELILALEGSPLRAPTSLMNAQR